MTLIHPPIAPWRVRRDDGLLVALLVDRDDLAEASVRVQTDNEEEFLPLRAAGRSGALHRLEALVPWDHANVATLYCFRVVHGGRTRWLAADGEHAFLPAEAQMFRAAHETPPDWVRDQVFYQVFPDRFARAGDAPELEGRIAWGGRPQPMVAKAWGEPIDDGHGPATFYGGNLDGLVERLDHVAQTVGATALYLNPVFASASNHRYDTEDYERVDPLLGGDAALVRLADTLRARGMRFVLDAVVNHTGTNHPWFNRWGNHDTLGAAQSADSPWRRWYAFETDGTPVGWKCHASLPVLDYAHPQVQQAVYAGPDAVLRRWLRPPVAADGWRLDVIHMLGEGRGAHRNAEHVRAIRRAIKDENREAYVLGEHFGEATRWLQGDQEDGAMNYHGFTLPVWQWLADAGDPARLATADFDAWLTRARASIGHEQQLAQLNLLGSHDTMRIRTRFGGDAARVGLAMTLLFAYAGVPCVYYGDELGMEGGPDPDCRRCMDWSGASWDRGLLDHVGGLASLRRARKEWRRGAIATLAHGADWIAFARYTERAATVVVANRGAAVEAALPVGALPLSGVHWHGDAAPVVHAGHLLVALPACGSLILFADA